MIIPTTFTVKAVKVGYSIRITIPKIVVDRLQIKKGDFLEVSVTNGKMLVKKKEKD